jgi:hypothetical protein
MNRPLTFGPGAFGGGQLQGDRLVRLVYVDEAGISNPKQEPFLVVAAVVIDADKKLVAIERHLNRLVDRHIPERHRDGFVFHATELFNRGGPVFKRPEPGEENPEWPLERRLGIADDLAAIPKRFDLPLAFGIVERSNWPQTFDDRDLSPRDRAVGEHVTAFMLCAMKVEHWMRTHASAEVCLMVVEDNDQARTIIRETQSYNQDPRIRRELEIDEEARAYLPLKKIKEDPLFQRKKRSSPLQIADFCAYVAKRLQMGDERYERVGFPLQPYVIDAQWRASLAKQPSSTAA